MSRNVFTTVVTVVPLGRWNWWPSKMSRIPAGQPTGPAPDRAEGQTVPLAEVSHD